VFGYNNGLGLDNVPIENVKKIASRIIDDILKNEYLI